MSDAYIQANRDLWDGRTKLHAESSAEHHDRLVRLRTGQTTLDEIELKELGDVCGESLLHLRCHLGLDTLSWARLGAIVTGVDFSEEAIAWAHSLSKELNVCADFICSDIFELPAVLDGQFDIALASGGVLPWLPDLERWAQIIARYLKPGGTFTIRDGHPIRHVLLPPRIDATGEPIEHGYFHSTEPTRVEGRGSYAVPEADTVQTAYYWAHSLGEIVTALCGAGLRLEFLHEFPKVVENCRSCEEPGPERDESRVRHTLAFPRTLSIRATR